MTLVEKLGKVQDYLNGEGKEEFLDYYAAEHYTGPIMIVENDEIATLHLTKGHIDEITEGKPDQELDNYLGIGGESWVWDHLKDYYQRSIQTVNESFMGQGGWTSYGPTLLYRQFNNVLSHIARIYSYVRDNDEIYCDHPQRDPDVPLPEKLDFVRGFYEELNGVKVYVETNDGPTDKGVIIALHTAGRENRQYHDIMNILKDKVRVYAPDMPGHGKSWPLQGNKVLNEYPVYGEWIKDLTEKLGVDNPIYIGCSMAGQMVYHMAIEYPELTLAAVCIQGSADTTLNDSSNMIPFLTHPANNVGVSQRDYSDSLIGQKTSESRKDFVRWGVAMETSVLKLGDYQIAFNNDLREDLAKITCPVRIIQGTDDTLFTVEMAQESYDCLTGTEDKKLHLIEDYGHFMIVENPEVVSEILEDLVDSL